ncbi:MAG: hypothetical protein EOM34_06260 [Clostridia bacterium]|nr:stage III sporulation protein AF [Lachnospiraceae bacterium]NCC00267.1 hypothetical protein [Clostridia bacterium]NCD02291.1 hypothetical protein [Clostridia bacterium]
MGIFREWMQNIVVFLLLTTMVGHLIPDEKYKKYIRVTTGLLLIMVVITPLSRLLNLDEKIYENFMQENLFLSAENAQAGSKVFEEDELFIKGYRQTIVKEVVAYFEAESMVVKYCDPKVDKEKVESIRIGLTSKDRNIEKAERDISTISEVIIGESRAEDEDAAYIPETKKKQWVNDLSLQFGIDRERIELELL